MTWNRYKLFLLICLVSNVLACQSISPIAPPRFDYKTLASEFFNKPSSGHFPLTINRAASLQSISLPSGYLFYTTNLDGSGDIWVRSMHNTINVPVVQHPAEQNHPALPEKGDRLVFVSQHQDSGGDLMILPIQPNELIRGALDGLPPVNYWEDAINLSRQINIRSQNLPPGCRLESAQSNPVFSKDGNYLFYISNRCNSDQYDIWVLQMQGLNIVDGPHRLTTRGASQISISHDMKHLAFISGNGYGSIYELEFDTRTWNVKMPQARKIDLGEEPWSQKRRLIASPVFSTDGKYLFYQIVNEDSNSNGYLDLGDNGSINRVSIGYTADGRIQAGIWKPLMESSIPLLSLNYSNLVGGLIIYAARLYNSANLYFMSVDGVIPRKDTIEEQYLFAMKFLDKSPKRYIIALDSVFYYFGETPEFNIYEGRILHDKMEFFARTNNNKQLIEIRKDLNSAREQNSYISLENLLYKSGYKSKDEKIQILKNYIAGFEKKYSVSELAQDSSVEYAHALYLLSVTQKDNSDYKSSLINVKKLNDNFTNYFRRVDSVLLEAWLETWLERRISKKYNAIIIDPKTRLLYSDRTHRELYQLLIEHQSRFEFEKENSRQELETLIKATINLVQATQLYNENEHIKALDLANKVIESIPMEDFRKRRRPHRPWNGLYVRLWQLKYKIHEAMGDYNASFFDKIVYGGAYNNQSSASIKQADFKEIIDESDLFIQNYLNSARELADFSDHTLASELDKNKVSEVLGISVNPIVEIDSINKETLLEFCKPQSRNSKLFFAIGGNHYKDYLEFCKENQNRLEIDENSKITLKNVQKASSLFYTGAYAYSSILNVLFFNMNGTLVFEDLYKTRAYYYHKLKIDIAKEKQSRETSRRQKFIFLVGKDKALKLLKEDDIFDSKIYDELEYGYSLTSEENIQVGDTAMLLGHAYLLITRASEKEKFYMELLSQGDWGTANFFRNQKEIILQDFKNAEYLLKYILNIDPLNAQAYLLLGWMYQYLDQQREKPLQIEADLLTRIYNYFTDSRWVTLDRIYYADFYDTYFNFRFYETNISLYNRYLEIYQNQPVQPEELAAVNLNLGNNYFLLLNFKQAIKSYQKVRKYLIRYSSKILSSYRQEALFNINFGRSYFFEGKPHLASKHLRRAYTIYEKNELNNITEKIKNLEYRKKSKKSGLKNHEIARLNILKSEHKKTMHKLTLILALNGMADWDAGNYEDSILKYRSSIRNLTDTGDEQSGIDQTSLLNFLAMSYSGNEQFEKSDKYSTLASQRARDNYLIRNEKRYNPETVGGKLLGCIIDFGEDFSVVGQGRNPYGFSSLRQYELALGIQFQNRILMGDLDGAEYLMKQRQQIFLTRDIDRKLGQNGFLNVLNQQGRNNYDVGDFDSSISNFKKATQASYKYDQITSFRLNFINNFRVVFASFERKLIEADKIQFQDIEKFQDYENLLSEFRDRFREKLVFEYIKQSKIEYPDYEFDPQLDNPIIDKLARERLFEINELDALLLYYKGIFSIKNASDLNEFSRGYEFLRSAREAFLALVNLSKNKDKNKLRYYIRLELNYARAALASENYRSAVEIANRLIEHSFEYDMLFEKFSSHYLMAESIAKISDPENADINHKKIVSNIEEAVKIIKNNSEIFHHQNFAIKNFFRFAISYFIKQKNYNQALLYIENDSEFSLMQEYLRYPLVFDRKSLQTQYNRIRMRHYKLAQYHEDEIQLRILRKSTKKIEQKKAILRSRLKIAKKNFARSFPLHKPFTIFTESISDVLSLADGEIVIGFFLIQNQVEGFCLWNNEIRQHRLENNKADSYKMFIKSCIKNSDLVDVFLVPDRNSIHYNLQDAFVLPNQKSLKPVYISRLGDIKQRFIRSRQDIKNKKLNLFNVNSFGQFDINVPEQNHTDIASIALDNRKYMPLFAGGDYRAFNAREWVRKHRNQSVIILQYDQDVDFERIMGMYEIFRLKGVGSVILTKRSARKVKEEIFVERGVKPYSQRIVFGFRGFQSANLVKTIKAKAIGKMLTGETWERKYEPQKALNYYNLADSYFSLDRDSKNTKNLRNQLNILRVKLKINVFVKPDELIDQFLSRNKSSKEAYDAILVQAIKTLLLLAEFENANHYLAILKSRDFEKYELSKMNLQMMKIIMALQTNSLKTLDTDQAGLKKRMNIMFPLFAKQYAPATIIPLFWKHGLYEIEEDYFRFLENKNIYQKSIPSFRDRIQIEKKLLAGRAGLKSFSDFLLRFNITHDNGQNNKSIQSYRKNLIDAGKNHVKNKLLDIHLIKNKKISDTESIFEKLNLEERSLLFFLLKENLKYDFDLHIRKSIDELILVETQSGSLWRAWQMNRTICEAYIGLSDFAVAYNYFKNLKKLEYANILNPQDEIAYSKIYSIVSLQFPLPLNDSIDVNKKMIASGNESIINLFSNIPKQFSKKNRFAFLSSINKVLVRNKKSGYQYVYLALSTAKKNAINIRDYKSLIDLESLEHTIRKNEVMADPRSLDEKLVFDEVAGKIINNIPENQVFFVLIPFKSGSYRLAIRKNQIKADLLPESGRRFHALQSIYSDSEGDLSSSALITLQKRYKRFFVDSSSSELVYFFLGHDFALAPIKYYKKDRIVQVTSLYQLSKNQNDQSVLKSENTSGIEVINIQNNCTNDLNRDLDLKLDNKIQSMELHSIYPLLKKNNPARLHVLGSISLCSLEKTFGKIKKRNGSTRFYFLSRIYYPKKKQNALLMWYKLQIMIENNLPGPGILTMNIADGINHAYMVREFYSKKNARIPLIRNFILAYLSMYEHSQKTNSMPGQYRLVTDRFMKN